MLFTSGRLGWDPFAEMRRMQAEMDRLFADFEGRPTPGGGPPVNLWLGDDSVVVTAEVPGVAPGDIDITVREDTLTIQGKRQPAAVDGEVAWHRRERVFGEFARTVELPFRVDADRVDARFVNGVIQIELQRPEADKPKRIPIKAS